MKKRELRGSMTRPARPSAATTLLSDTISKARGKVQWPQVRDVGTTASSTLSWLEHANVGSVEQWNARLAHLDGVISDLMEIKALLTPEE